MQTFLWLSHLRLTSRKSATHIATFHFFRSQAVAHPLYHFRCSCIQTFDALFWKLVGCKGIAATQKFAFFFFEKSRDIFLTFRCLIFLAKIRFFRSNLWKNTVFSSSPRSRQQKFQILLSGPWRPEEGEIPTFLVQRGQLIDSAPEIRIC